MLMDMLRNSSPLALLGLSVSLATVGMALAYAMKPSERKLALMRPLSLAAIFGGLNAFTAGAVAILQGIAATGTFGVADVAMGTAEAITALFFAFGCLTIAWLLVALGLRRSS